LTSEDQINNKIVDDWRSNYIDANAFQYRQIKGLIGVDIAGELALLYIIQYIRKTKDSAETVIFSCTLTAVGNIHTLIQSYI
jgi:hypothetical protein